MRSTILMFGNPGKNEKDLNERLAEKEKEGWEVVEMQTTRPSFGTSPVIILRLGRGSS